MFERQDTQNLLVRALIEYREKLELLMETEELRPFKVFLEDDIKVITHDVELTLSDFESSGGMHFADVVKRQKNFIVNALDVYMSELEKARDKCWEELGAKPTLANLDTKLRFA